MLKNGINLIENRKKIKTGARKILLYQEVNSKGRSGVVYFVFLKTLK